MDVPIFRLDRYTLPQAHILPDRATVELEITRGRVQQRVRGVRSKVFLIGAANDCDLVLGDLQFPEAYAYLFVNGHEVSIRRLGSGPELLVCGEPADTAELFHGDLIAFGPFELRVRIAAPAGRSHSQSDEADAAGDLALNRTDQAAAHDEVEALLLDIRRGLAEDPPTPEIAAPARHTSPATQLPRLLSSPLRA